MLERKRRARINRCLDELKELLVGALQAEGESVSRLEKADVLELTVRHLHKLRRAQQLSESAAHDRFRAGFSHCANEVAKYITTLPAAIDIGVSARLLSHLDGCIRGSDGGGVIPPPRSSPLVINNYTPPSSPLAGSNSPGNKILQAAQPIPAHHQPVHFRPDFLQRSPPIGFHPHPHLLPPIMSPNTSVGDEPFDLSSGSVWRPW